MKAMDNYCASKHDSSIRFKLDTLKQNDGESLLDYVIRLKPLAKLAGIATNVLNKELLSRITYNTTSLQLSERKRWKRI